MRRFTFTSILLFVFSGILPQNIGAQCDFTFDSQVFHCDPQELVVYLDMDPQAEDSMVITMLGTNYSLTVTQAQGISYVLTPDVDTILATGYPSLCELMWVRLDWTGEFSAGFEITDTSSCLSWYPSQLAIDPSGGWSEPGATYEYTLEFPDGSTATGDTFDVQSGLHILSFNDAFGCYQADTIDIVNYSESVEIEVVTTGSNCDSNDGTASIVFLLGDPPYGEIWMDENMNQIGGGQTIENLAPGNYFVRGLTDDCEATKAFTIDGLDLNFSVTPNLVLTCDVPEVVAEVTIDNQTSDHIIAWYDSQDNLIGDANAIALTVEGSYYVEVSYLNCVEIETFEVTVNATSNWLSCVVDPLDCGDSITCVTLQFPGDPSNYSIDWGNPDIPNIYNPCILTAGTYTVVATDLSTGCVSEFTFSIIQADELLVDVMVYPASCTAASDAYVTVTVSGGAPPYSYNWTSNSNWIGPYIGPVAGGTYILIITDANGCESEETVVVPFGTMIGDIDVTCASNSSDGSVFFLENNPDAGITYNWEGGNTATQSTITGLASGLYNFTVTNSEGTCEEIHPVAICYDSLFIISDYQICQGDSLLLNASAIAGNTFQYWENVDFNGINCDTCSMVYVNPNINHDYRAWYLDDATGLINAWEFRVDVIQDCVWPGDVDTNLVVDHFDLLPLCLSLGKVGPSRAAVDINWYGQEAVDWAETIPGYTANTKHADCNGNGLVALEDTSAIIQNWGSQHKTLNVPISQSLTAGVPMYLDIDSIPSPGITVSIPFVVGNMDTMATDIYGMAFSINFDPDLVVDNGTQFVPTNSWFSTGSPEVAIVQKEFASAGRVDVAISRTDITNTTGYGAIAEFIIIMEDDILRAVEAVEGSRASAVPFEFSISNVRLINAFGKEIDASPRTGTAFVYNTNVGTYDPTLASKIHVFPNPTGRYQSLFVQSDLFLESYQLIDLYGRVIAHEAIKNKEINLPEIAPGVYQLRFQTQDDLWIMKKIVVQ